MIEEETPRAGVPAAESISDVPSKMDSPRAESTSSSASEADSLATEPASDLPSEAGSVAVIEHFLAESGGAVVREQGAIAAGWDEALPPGHRSGFLALIGRPNVGKSTLVNALIGHKVTIVSPVPQTTRHRVTGILTDPQYQMIFVDTPGIHRRPPHRINRIMIDEAVAAIPDADAILWVVDSVALPRDEDETIARLLREKGQTRPVLLVLNKLDRLEQLPADKAAARVAGYERLLPDRAGTVHVSALRETNLDLLLDQLLTFLPEGPRYYPGDQITDQTEHRIAAELIREAVFRNTYREIPHAAAVLVEDYYEREDGVQVIAARIWVERESQKPIVIGKGGLLLKRIGTEARLALERFLGSKVYLELWVKVKPNWRDELARLRELGF